VNYAKGSERDIESITHMRAQGMVQIIRGAEGAVAWEQRE
jgi:hypothetical protein